jgi:hypothetical protein
MIIFIFLDIYSRNVSQLAQPQTAQAGLLGRPAGWASLEINCFVSITSKSWNPWGDNYDR